MATIAAPPTHLGLTAAVLAFGCDGYPAGTTGTVIGRRQGCFEFVPDAPETVARWATPRTSLLVPAAFIVTDE